MAGDNGASRSGTPWTEEEIYRLRKGIAAKEPRADIARDLGRSVNAIATMAYELGLVRRGTTRRADLDLPTDNTDEVKFRQECAEANARYVQAVIAAGGGTWSGLPGYNGAGSTR